MKISSIQFFIISGEFRLFFRNNEKLNLEMSDKNGPSQTLIQLLKELGYSYHKCIGKGGFAKVFLIHSEQYNEKFVCKENYSKDSSILYQDAELEVLQKIIHPNVIKIYQSFYCATNQCLILEYCKSGSFDIFIKEKGPLKPPLLFEWAKQILEALLYIHNQGFVHRNIKPANILIDKYGRPKVADFGISEEAAIIRNQQKFSGSLPFMAPELIDHAHFDPKLTDIWALGVTFYFMATGKIP
jgi:serine/threonine protein kinase